MCGSTCVLSMGGQGNVFGCTVRFEGKGKGSLKYDVRSMLRLLTTDILDWARVALIRMGGGAELMGWEGIYGVCCWNACLMSVRSRIT